MSDGISAPFIRYPIATSLLMAGILFVGLVAYPLLPVAPLPQVDFPTIQVAASPARREPGNHGVVGGAAARAQFAQIPGVTQMTSTSYLGTSADHDPVRPQPQHRRRRQRRAGGHQRRRRPAAEEPALAADLSQGQSGRFADHAVVGDVGHVAADRRSRTTTSMHQLAQQISQISGVAQVTIGGQQKPAIRVQIDPAKLGGQRPVAGRRAQPDRDHHRRQPQGQDRRRDAGLHHLRQRPADGARRTGTTSSSPIAMARPIRIRDIGRAVTGPEDASRPPGPTASAACSWSCSSSPAPTSSRRSTDQGGAAAARSGHAAVDQDRGLSDRTQTIRASVEDVQFTLMLTIALVVMVIFVFLRNVLGHRRSRASPCRCRCLAPAR